MQIFYDQPTLSSDQFHQVINQLIHAFICPSQFSNLGPVCRQLDTLTIQTLGGILGIAKYLFNLQWAISVFCNPLFFHQAFCLLGTHRKSFLNFVAINPIWFNTAWFRKYLFVSCSILQCILHLFLSISQLVVFHQAVCVFKLKCIMYVQ